MKIKFNFNIISFCLFSHFLLASPSDNYEWSAFRVLHT